MARSRFARRSVTLAGIALLLLAGAVPVHAAAPANDLLTRPVVFNPDVIAGSIGATNIDATSGNEPIPSCKKNVGASVWFRYSPPARMRMTFSTSASQAPALSDPVLAVYKPTNNGFQQVACNDNGGGGQHASVTLIGSAGTSYYIQASGVNGASGNFALNYAFALANDPFGNAQAIKPGFAAAVNTARASGQASEPQGCSVAVANTVWYKFQPSKTGTVSFDTFGSSFDTVVTVWKGKKLSKLTFVACHDDIGGTADRTSQVNWSATKGTTYYIQVGGYFAVTSYGDLKVNFVRLP